MPLSICSFEVYVAISERGDQFVHQIFSQQLQFPVAYHLLPAPFGSGEGSVESLGPESKQCVHRIAVIAILWASTWSSCLLLLLSLPVYAARFVLAGLWPVAITLVWSAAQWEVIRMNAEQSKHIQVNTVAATCTLASDIAMITHKIMSFGGFEILDQTITKLRRTQLDHFFTKRKLFIPIFTILQAAPPLVLCFQRNDLDRGQMLALFFVCTLGVYAWFAFRIVYKWPQTQWF